MCNKKNCNLDLIDSEQEGTVILNMPRNVVKGLVRHIENECSICKISKEDAELTICRACQLTICKGDCMANKELCENCMQELQEDGEFTFNVDDEFLKEMKEKYL